VTVGGPPAKAGAENNSKVKINMRCI
jgi:hypothetical protein